jgi:outer membrane protein assembly factor BamB
VREAAPKPPAEPPRTIAPEPPKPAPVPKPQVVRPEQFVWAYPEQAAAEEQATPLRNAPVVDASGRIFVHLQDRLVALTEEDCKPKLLWEYVTGSRAPGPVVLGPQDTIRLHCGDGYLHCLDAPTGKQIWSPAHVGEPLGYAAPICDQDGNSWISSADGGLIRVDYMGRVQKSPYFRSRQKFDAPGVISGGVLYIGSEHGYVFAIDLQGERGTNRWNHAAEQGYVGIVRSSPMLTADGIYIVAGQDETLYGLAPSGSIAWKTPMPGQMLGSPVADRFGHMYVGVSVFPRGLEPRGMLVCIDGNSHKVRWEYRAAGPVESTPVIGDDDTIYFGDNTGAIHAINFLGRGQWTAQVGSPVRSAGAIVAPQRVAFGVDNETLIVLKCSSAGLAAEGWPKIGRTRGQSGLV